MDKKEGKNTNLYFLEWWLSLVSLAFKELLFLSYIHGYEDCVESIQKYGR